VFKPEKSSQEQYRQLQAGAGVTLIMILSLSQRRNAVQA